jgi:hypothetical protein
MTRQQGFQLLRRHAGMQVRHGLRVLRQRAGGGLRRALCHSVGRRQCFAGPLQTARHGRTQPGGRRGTHGLNAPKRAPQPAQSATCRRAQPAQGRTQKGLLLGRRRVMGEARQHHGARGRTAKSRAGKATPVTADPARRQRPHGREVGRQPTRPGRGVEVGRPLPGGHPPARHRIVERGPNRLRRLGRGSWGGSGCRLGLRLFALEPVVRHGRQEAGRHEGRQDPACLLKLRAEVGVLTEVRRRLLDLRVRQAARPAGSHKAPHERGHRHTFHTFTFHGWVLLTVPG